MSKATEGHCNLESVDDLEYVYDTNAHILESLELLLP